MWKIKNNIATDVNERITLKEYAAYGSTTAVSRVYSAMAGFFGALVASTFLGLSEGAFATYSTIIFVLGFWDIANDVIVFPIVYLINAFPSLTYKLPSID